MASFMDAFSWSHSEFADKPEEPPPPAAQDEAALAESMRQATQAMAAAVASSASAGAVEVVERNQVDDRKQAFYDTIFAVACADGSISPDERSKVAVGLRGLLGDGFEESSIDQGLETARAYYQEHGLKGTAANIASTIGDEAERYSLLTVASAIAWLGGGVGTKEGLALQALAAAFGIPINKLHETMAGAARIVRS